jgi:hypothetical protein
MIKDDYMLIGSVGRRFEVEDGGEKEDGMRIRSGIKIREKARAARSIMRKRTRSYGLILMRKQYAFI